MSNPLTRLSVIGIDYEGIRFGFPDSNQTIARIASIHPQDGNEEHYLCFDDLRLKDFEGLQFDITGDAFLHRIEGYGIELVATNGQKFQIPGYGDNNGNYSSEISLLVIAGDGQLLQSYEVSECQKITWQ